MNTFFEYIKTASRNIFRSKFYSLLNILGFALGFTICIISGLYVYREFSVDKNFKDYQHIYRIIDDENNTSLLDYDLAQKLQDKFPEIEYAIPAYISVYELVVKELEHEKSVIIQNTISTENNFFNIFQLDFLAGNPSDPFNSEESIIVSKSLAEKLFGHTDVVGKLIHAGGAVHPINAVVQNLAENSSFKADMYLTSATGIRLQQACKTENNCYSSYPIFVLVNRDTDTKALENKMNDNFPENKSETKKIRLQPLTDIYFDKTVTDNNNYPGNRSLVFVFITIAVIVLILSIINYVNFALSQQLATLKQLGIKIAHGASMKQLRSYYMVEIGLSVLLSFFLSLVICALSIPLFEDILGVRLNSINILTPVFMLSILSVLTIVILVSSLTPFYIISKYDIQMLFGKRNTYFGKQRGKLFLTGCQMAITIVLFICLFMLQKQLNYMKGYDVGFDKNNLIRLEVPNGMSEVFENEIAQYNCIQNSVRSFHAPGFMGAAGLQRNEQTGKEALINLLFTDINFINTFGIQLIQGRDFTDADREHACIVTKETMRQLGWNDIEGKKYNDLKVIGVVEDFNISSLHNRAEPINIIPLNREQFAYSIVSINYNGDVSETLRLLQQSWDKMFPGEPFNYRLYSEVFNTFYKKEERLFMAIAIISFIAVIITCMGLIGQVKQISLSKAREIGIRKINGATIAEVMFVIPKSFLKSFVAAFVVAVPVAWISINKWLENFAYKATISWWVFVLSGVLVFLILALFISWQTWIAAIANPISSIKSE